MKYLTVITLLLAMALSAPAYARHHCGPEPKNDCKPAGPEPRPPSSSLCDDLARRIENVKSDIEDMEGEQRAIQEELQRRADRDVTAAQTFLAEQAASLVTPGLRGAKRLAQEVATNVLSAAMQGGTSSGSFGDLAQMSTEDLARIAALLPVYLKIKYTLLQTLQTALADCWRLFDIDYANYKTDKEKWDARDWAYEECVKDYESRKRSWDRCRE